MWGKGDFLEIRIWILAFDSFDPEALDWLAQGGEFVEPFEICFLVLVIFTISLSN